jgi:prolipoprotein diacylglyceryltransferase
VGGHSINALYYGCHQATELLQGDVGWQRPLALLRPWHGWRSAGGLFGGLAASVLWSHYRFESTVMVRWPGWFAIEGYWFVRRAQRVPTLALADVLLSVFPLAWVLHRIGSVLVRDQADVVSTLDLLITAALLALVITLWKGRFRAGFYVCLAGLTYAPARVAIGFFRQSANSAPDLAGALSLTQWGFALATLMSLGLMIRLYWASLRSRLGAS